MKESVQAGDPNLVCISMSRFFSYITVTLLQENSTNQVPWLVGTLL